jgi:hypothetical protein
MWVLSARVSPVPVDRETFLLRPHLNDFNSCLAGILLLFGETGRYVLFLLSLNRLSLSALVRDTVQKKSALGLIASAER